MLYFQYLTIYMFKKKMDIDGECVYYICRSTKSRVRGHLRIYLGYFTLPDGSESPTAESPTPPSLEVGML